MRKVEENRRVKKEIKELIIDYPIGLTK